MHIKTAMHYYFFSPGSDVEKNCLHSQASCKTPETYQDTIELHRYRNSKSLIKYLKKMDNGEHYVFSCMVILASARIHFPLNIPIKGNIQYIR
jgi:hypothetical protein